MSLIVASACASFDERSHELPRRMLEVTFDDLPYVAQPFPESVSAGRRVTERLLAGLAAPAVGFVNEVRLEVPDEREARIGGSRAATCSATAPTRTPNLLASWPQKIDVHDPRESHVNGSVLYSKGRV